MVTLDDKQHDDLRREFGAMCESLDVWLKRGGDKRLLEFAPLDRWCRLLEAMRPVMMAPCGCEAASKAAATMKAEMKRVGRYRPPVS